MSELDRDGHNPTVYGSTSEMKYWENGGIPFDDPKPDNGCWNCTHYDGNHCFIHQDEDACEDWEEYEDADP